ncbi:MAG: NAD-dependent epimerase/dehydratase family protein, partial [Legionellales bacterium]|nr:NAD-dependent epimerase/dehydratase family protein [Legionellales bacterium]
MNHAVVLITGCAGFIGAATTQALLKQANTQVIGIDNLNDYYDVNLKHARLAQFAEHPRFTFYPIDLADQSNVLKCFQQHQPTGVLHLAAQAGVRYSITHPHTYVHSNLVGFANVLEACRHTQVQHLVFASSSSVYGNLAEQPWSETATINRPISLYAATKASNELMAYTYSHLYDIPMTGLRYFTVYGPWGRPDMAPFKFTQAIVRGQPIHIHNHGQHLRDFTFIDDIVSGTLATLHGHQFTTHPVTPAYKVYNIGYGQPTGLLDFIELLEQTLGQPAI